MWRHLRPAPEADEAPFGVLEVTNNATALRHRVMLCAALAMLVFAAVAPRSRKHSSLGR